MPRAERRKRPGKLLRQATAKLAVSELDLARQLDMPIAALRHLDHPNPPRYLRLVLAATIAGLDADRILTELQNGPLAAGDPGPSLRAQ
ncbi:hypothetical protein [Mesorhizobium retamae]|uniref:Transcriptional regulator n=1 Tax=Mesorhizobium retamae TaxID=2912854 RepID=A0ABS9QPE6_9HYPH|nr:hypothetical protein [Mesorhizobium sp. IRAMC:0171]MCG7509321.1 hypothetical protein [Mesorhizobium sp. IRAMC:0171]